jgi:hypothetical protein
VVWLRLGMAQFGVTTLMVSLVLSLCMGGLAFGSVVAARVGRRLGGTASVLLRLYAAAELLIAPLGHRAELRYPVPVRNAR